MTVQELMDALALIDPGTPVLGTFEGVTNRVDVYLAQGHVLFDVDSAGDSYKKEWQSGQKSI